jgi:signal transduction histidine kinase/FixJ family two-component response regulator
MPPTLQLMIKIAFYWLMLTTSISSMAAVPAIILDQNSKQIALGNYASYLEDTDGSYTLKDIIQLDPSNFEVLTEESLNKGFTNSTYWLKFSVLDKTLDNKTQSWKLETTYPLLDYLDIYLLDKDNNVEHFKMGDVYLYDQRPVNHRNFIVPITLQDNEVKDVYIRVNTSSSMQIPVFIWHPDYFFEARSGEQYGLGLYYGMMFVMFFYNFFLWFSIRDSNYLWYIGYLAAFALLQASTSGLGYQYVWPNSPWLESIAPPVSIALVGIFGTAFTRRFLHTQQYHIVADNLLRLVLYLSLIVLGLSFIADTATVMGLAKIVVVTFLLFILYASVAMLLRGHRQARFFLAAWVSLILGGLFTIGMMLGLFPNTFLMTHASKIGSVIEIILLSFALADRIKVIEKEKQLIERRAQKELERTNKKLAENNRLKDEFLATISHEFRTPLNGILGSLELALQEPVNSITPHIVTAKGSTDEMLSLVDQVLSYTELQSGHFIIRAEPINLPEILLELTQNINQQCQNKGINFSIENNARNPQTIIADKKRLQQALIPIFDNAIKFTDEGHINLNVQIKFVDKQYLLLFKIEDTGIGIAAEKQENILEAFTQGDGSFSRQFGGLGIGLSLVKALCTQLGGTISISSEVNYGTLVEVSLPIDIPHQAFTAAPQSAPVTKTRAIKDHARILIVEDNHINQVVLKTMLQRLNIDAETADHGIKALSILEQSRIDNKPIDLILMDCQMPIMDGFDATQNIRKSPHSYANTPIIAVTANALSSDRERCLQCGMNDYLSKPFQLDDIRRKLQTWLPQPDFEQAEKKAEKKDEEQPGNA